MQIPSDVLENIFDFADLPLTRGYWKRCMDNTLAHMCERAKLKYFHNEIIPALDRDGRACTMALNRGVDIDTLRLECSGTMLSVAYRHLEGYTAYHFYSDWRDVTLVNAE